MSRSGSRRSIAGMIAFLVAMVALIVMTFLPTPYVIQRPGPVYDTLGTAKSEDGTEIPLIAIEGAETYETSGTLDLTTVQVVGNRENTPSWVEIALAWMDASRAVVPVEAVFPEGVTAEDREAENAALMTNSQHEATAAALNALDYDTKPAITVVSIVDDSAAVGLIEPEDIITAVDGTSLTDGEELRQAVRDSDGAELTLSILRAGTPRDVTVTPKAVTQNGETTWLVGIQFMTKYTFPIDITIQLDNVGGPSAGMMFALGIYDELTPGKLTGGKKIAGTGTITAGGAVGPIGGIRHKLYGARDAGAQYFLAPAENCNEVVGHIPNGLTVFRTESLATSLEVLEGISTNADLSALPRCEASG